MKIYTYICIYEYREKETEADEVYIAAETAAAAKRKALRDVAATGMYIYTYT
jgi:hypothetical protein